MDAGPIDTSSEQRPPSEGEAELRYGATWPQRLLTGAPMLCLLPPLYLMVFPFDRSTELGGPPLWLRVEAWALPVLFVLNIWAQGWWFGVTLTSQVAVVRTLRRRTIPWTRVADVGVEAFRGGGRRVVLYETDGRRTPLRMPSTVFLAGDRKFDMKAAAIREWWLTHGGGEYE